MATELEIICVGNELLIGKIENTNAFWLTKQATQLGANVKRIMVVQDIAHEIADAINEAIARKPKFIITTGGLGPTFDDLTLQGVAKALNCKLEVNEKALEMVMQSCREYAKKRHGNVEVGITPSRIKMATLPQKTEPVRNPVGAAPGVRTEVDGTALFVLPGVPSEMEAIFNETIAPLVRQAVGGSGFFEVSVFVEDGMESRLVPFIDHVMKDNTGVYIKSHVCVKSHSELPENQRHIELHLTITAKPEEEPTKKLLKAAKEIVALIGADGGRAQISG